MCHCAGSCLLPSHVTVPAHGSPGALSCSHGGLGQVSLPPHRLQDPRATVPAPSSSPLHTSFLPPCTEPTIPTAYHHKELFSTNTLHSLLLTDVKTPAVVWTAYLYPRSHPWVASSLLDFLIWVTGRSPWVGSVDATIHPLDVVYL